MPPMARTSRGVNPANNVDALDNIDLDDIFTAGGDALFDGLDLDMGNMEDIANSPNGGAAGNATAVASTPSPATATPAPRRKTKRKTTAPTFFDDLDDDYVDQEPAKKKKRTSKGATTAGTKRVKGKKGAGAATTTMTADTETSRSTAKSGGSTKKNKATRTLPMKRATNDAAASTNTSASSMTPSMVATSGQFGGRQKKGIGPKAAVKGKTAKAKVPPKSRPSSLAATTTPPIQKPTLPLFCGLGPSDTLFFPFLPNLPQEVALKNRKMYQLLDRIHSSFVTQLGQGNAGSNPPTPEGVTAVSENESIFKLMQDAYKEDKNAPTPVTVEERCRTIGTAIGAVRKSMSLFDKAKLADNLLTICALLRRQHDFVKQNNANMERWCRGHFNDDDFSSVYHDGKKKRKGSAAALSAENSRTNAPVLFSFKVPILKVKLKFTGFKEPKATLLASLPSDAKRMFLVKGNKKKPEADSAAWRTSLLSTTGVLNAASAGATTIDADYSHQTSLKRRKAVGALLARVAQSLESRRIQSLEKAKQARSVQEKRLRDAAEEQNSSSVHTAGMWKYVQESGYFDETVTDAELQSRIDWIQAVNVPTRIVSDLQGTFSTSKNVSNHVTNESVAGRLIGLLVEEGDSDTEESQEDDDLCSLNDSVSAREDVELMDLSLLTKDERTRIKLEMMGLGAANVVVRNLSGSTTQKKKSGDSRTISNETLTVVESSKAEHNSQCVLQNGTSQNSIREENEAGGIDQVIGAMIEDLEQTNDLISARADFARKLARSRLETPQSATRRKQQEVSAMARNAALLKRNKEAKSKAVKAKSHQDDELKLPW